MKLQRLIVLLCMAIILLSGCQKAEPESITLTAGNIESYLHITQDMSDGKVKENYNSYYGEGVVKIVATPCSSAKFENVTIEMKLVLNPFGTNGKLDTWRFLQGGTKGTWNGSVVQMKNATMTISYDGDGLIEEEVYIDYSKTGWYYDTKEWNALGFKPNDCSLHYEITSITGNAVIQN